MRKLFGLFLVLSLLGGCKESTGPVTAQTGDSLEFQYQSMPEKLPLSPESAPKVETWEEFMALGQSMDVLYRATNNEDLALAVEDLIVKEKELSGGVYPEPFDTQSIKSRQLVLRTYLYRLKASILENRPTTEPTVAMLEAYNALRKQMNLIVKTQLDRKLILDAN